MTPHRGRCRRFCTALGQRQRHRRRSRPAVRNWKRAPASRPARSARGGRPGRAPLSGTDGPLFCPGQMPGRSFVQRRRRRTGGSAWSRRRLHLQAAPSPGPRPEVGHVRRAESPTRPRRNKRVVGVQHEPGRLAPNSSRHEVGPTIGRPFELHVRSSWSRNRFVQQHHARFESSTSGQQNSCDLETGRAELRRRSTRPRERRRAASTRPHAMFAAGSVVDMPITRLREHRTPPSRRSLLPLVDGQHRRAALRRAPTLGESHAGSSAISTFPGAARAAACRGTSSELATAAGATIFAPSAIIADDQPDRVRDRPHGHRQLGDRVAVGVHRECDRHADLHLSGAHDLDDRARARAPPLNTWQQQQKELASTCRRRIHDGAVGPAVVERRTPSASRPPYQFEFAAATV